MKLSISVAFCDKDFKYLSQCLNQMKEKVHIGYEVILVDNRNDQTPFDIPEGCIYTTKGHNTYCFEGRRQGLAAATGDFIWFFDVDDFVDEPILPEDIEGIDASYDLIQFYYSTNPPNKEFEHFNPKTRPVHNPRAIPRTMSCRWFNVQTLRRKLAPLTQDEIVLMNGEDNFIVDLMTLTGTYKYKVLPKYYYIYNIGIAQHIQIMDNDNVDSLAFVLRGHSNLDYMYSCVPISPFYYKLVKATINGLLNKYKKLTGKDYVDEYNTTKQYLNK